MINDLKSYFLGHFLLGNTGMRINRENILKDLLNKVKEAKRLNMKEVKFPIKELDDLAYVVYQLMAEDISKILELKDKKEEQPVKKPVKKDSERRVLEEIRPEPEPEIPSQNEPQKVEQEKPKFIVKNIEPEPVPEPEEPEQEEEDNTFTGLYGGTW